jgi:hypothetical protein
MDNTGITELYEVLQYNNGFILNNSKSGSKGGFVFYDPELDISSPTKDYRRFNYAFGTNHFGNEFYFAIDKSTYNDKTKTTNERSALYFSDKAGNLSDSMDLNFSIIYLPSITSPDASKVPMIIQLKGKMLLAVVEIKKDP